MDRKTVGVIGGSFDPITKGHEYLIAEAANIFDELHVVIGVNPTKKYHFSADEREAMLETVIRDIRANERCDIRISYLENDLLITKATELKATKLVRGMRSIADYEYETQMAMVNRKINPEISTIYIFPPPELSEVSSSIVRGLVGFNGWKDIVGQYVNPHVMSELERKHGEGRKTCASS